MFARLMRRFEQSRLWYGHIGRQYDNAVDFVGPLNFADQIGAVLCLLPGGHRQPE